MGSGLILLVIVGAWLAVLVPMALRSHDASTSLGTVDKFHDAMRVLSRRDGVARGRDSGAVARGTTDAGSDRDAPAADSRHAAVLPRAGSRRTDRGPVPDRDVDGRAGFGTAPALRRRSATPASVDSRPTGPTAVARRRRALVVLVALVVGSFVGAIFAPVWTWALHGAADLLLVGFLAWLRHETVLRAEREWRAAMAAPQRARRTSAAMNVAAPVAASRVKVCVPGRIAGIPDRMPSHAVVDPRWTLPVAGAPVPARGAQGRPWQPVPVPVPTYVTAPTAPRYSPALSRPAGRPEDLAEAERSLGIDDRGPALDEILSRRRAVGG